MSRRYSSALLLVALVQIAWPATSWASEPSTIAGSGAREPFAVPSGPALENDPVLKTLVDQALATRPELEQVRAAIRAEYQRVPQAGALPDPTLALGIQNDGFGGIQIGKMEGSFLSIMVAQTIPWAGKVEARSRVASVDARLAEVDLKRVELAVRAEVERGYIDLLQTRDRLALLDRLDALWTQAEGLARSRYETGQGAQSDLLRAQLERNRLHQRRWTLAAEEQQQLAGLNRLRSRPLDEVIAASRSLTDLPDPTLLDLAQAQRVALAGSPEIEKARLDVDQAERRIDLARNDLVPDVTLSAGLMPRWGKFEPMWQLGLAVPLPIWAGSKQSRAIDESVQRSNVASSSVDVVEQLLQQRVAERHALLRAVLESNQLYRTGLLAQSEATVASTVAQYQVGSVTFASVLEALAGYLGDLDGFLTSIATSQRIAIAERELSLDPVDGSGGGSMGSARVPGAGGIGSARSAAPATGPPAGETGTSMSRM